MIPAHMRRPGLMVPAALPKDGLRTTGQKKRKATGPRCLLSPKKNTSAACHRDGSQSTSSAPDSVREKDAFVFSNGDEQPKSDKEKIKMAVLRNISRMLAGNNQIRQRLMSLSQVQCSHTQPT
uniref:Uncharacterized protein n=1 Tax=Knipowitschia caucasica TaxID=637954 RepID=A0AAV2MLG0_KNICA